MKKLIIFIIVTFPCIVQSVRNTDNIYIDLDPGEDFPALSIPYRGSPPETKDIVITDSIHYMMKITDCRGKMYFQAFYGNKLRIEGKYINSLDTFKRCATVEDPFNPGVKILQIQKYFQPLKDSIWTYYDQSGKLINKEVWKKGIKVGM